MAHDRWYNIMRKCNLNSSFEKSDPNFSDLALNAINANLTYMESVSHTIESVSPRARFPSFGEHDSKRKGHIRPAAKKDIKPEWNHERGNKQRESAARQHDEAALRRYNQSAK